MWCKPTNFHSSTGMIWGYMGNIYCSMLHFSVSYRPGFGTSSRIVCPGHWLFLTGLWSGIPNIRRTQTTTEVVTNTSILGSHAPKQQLGPSPSRKGKFQSQLISIKIIWHVISISCQHLSTCRISIARFGSAPALHPQAMSQATLDLQGNGLKNMPTFSSRDARSLEMHIIT